MVDSFVAAKFGEPVLIPAHDKNSLELIDIYACTIDAKSCSALIGKLSTIAPVPRAIKHAKRIRKRRDQPGKVDVLLLPVHQEDSLEDEEEAADDPNPKTTIETTAAAATGPSFHQAPSLLPSGLLPFSALPLPPLASLLEDEGLTQGIFTVQIPRYAPHTKEDQISWGRYWPVGIQVPTKITLRDKVELLPEEITQMKRNMKIVLGMVNDQAKNGGQLGLNACLIVDPKDGTSGDDGSEIENKEQASSASAIIGSGVDETGVHPLRHAAMNAIESVADWQKKTWFSHPINKIKTLIKTDSKEEEDVKRRRLDPPTEEQQEDADVPIVDESTPYLCTGYDCYLLHEPCIMCAMALVHSRLRRVIFCRKDEEGGALGGCGLKLHSKRTLNHHYIVYHLPLLD
jgi:tRNA-specific adenosine deaminase 3